MDCIYRWILLVQDLVLQLFQERFSIVNGQLLKYVFMVVFTTALSFGLTYMFGYEDEASSVPAEDKEAEAIIEEETTGNIPASLQDETIISPIVGTCCSTCLM